ncbi:E3 ubiquitin-protein ligase rnf8-like isoform X1 [Acipenser ruthenus]|uniref:E3 ubiquitin-protein ligase rnf8-like isoform X1 n=1 Tax=Acipenser ruthenus TaxID=7906 RepID=UPI0027422A13|nr:E3 ubiquitin-protein ligase rnf8-like isoform X1 [Acipenser ruthenus]
MDGVREMAEESEVNLPVEEEDKEKEGIWCLRRVGKKCEWLLLNEETEVTLGRGLAVTYRILSLACPLMISRNHCVFKQNEESQWTVTDKKSLNGVWVNGKRIEPYKAHLLNEGDTVQLGVPIEDKGVEYEYVLIKDQLQNVAPFLHKTTEQDTEIAPRVKRTKRKYSSGEFDSEDSSNSKEKVSLSFSVDKSRSSSSLATEMAKQKPNHCESATPGPSRDPQEALPLQDTQDPTKLQPISQSSAELARLQDNMKRIQRLKIRVKEAEQQAASLYAQQAPEPQLNQVEEKLNVLRGQLRVEQQQQLLRVELLEKTFFEEEQRLEDEKKLQVEESLENKLDLALQEHRKVIEELRRSRKDFEEIIQAKDKELEETKEEKEKAKAQKEEVLTQMTEVLENELQCIICSELFFEAVTLNCAHSFCSHCINQWRKRKDECPICRQGIFAQTRSLVLDNCIDRMVENLSSEMKERRESLMRERKGESSVSGDGHDGNESSDFSSGSSISSVISTEESSSSSSSSSISWGSDTSSSSENSSYDGFYII